MSNRTTTPDVVTFHVTVSRWIRKKLLGRSLYSAQSAVMRLRLATLRYLWTLDEDHQDIETLDKLLDIAVDLDIATT